VSRYTVAIDPGKDTGFAVYDRIEKKLIRLETTDFCNAYHTIITEYSKAYAVVVEVPTTKANFTKSKNDSPIKNHNIGRVCRESELMADMLEFAGMNVIRQRPAGKKDASAFARITGWKGQTNPHKRDAGMMAFGV